LIEPTVYFTEQGIRVKEGFFEWDKFKSYRFIRDNEVELVLVNPLWVRYGRSRKRRTKRSLRLRPHPHDRVSKEELEVFLSTFLPEEV
jgi:hypothetical protein